MIESVIVWLVVAGAAFFSGRMLFRALSGKRPCGCGQKDCPEQLRCAGRKVHGD